MLTTLFGLIVTALNIIAIADVIGGNRSLGEKIVLIVLIIAFPFVGSLLYLLVLREKK